MVYFQASMNKTGEVPSLDYAREWMRGLHTSSKNVKKIKTGRSVSSRPLDGM